ncbi:MAG: endonuclease/exonuclease/phosphatase family protein [Acidobacteriota bacterium]|nr:endonuclease/exonuclease/phosphatase family protein [Acidobacteriota bacterium]
MMLMRSMSLVAGLGVALACGAPADEPEPGGAVGTGTRVRVALFNIRELTAEKILDVDGDGRGRHPQALAAARIIRRIAPDILILNEIDHDYETGWGDLALNARRFHDAYLRSGEGGLELPFFFAAPNNTGILTGLDLDRDGHVASVADRGTRMHGNDAFGFGTYPGEYSMAVLSKYPILDEEARTFQKLLWRDLPGHHIPEGVFSTEVLDVFRLSSKSHWDLPVDVNGRRLHLFVSHPTPQGFDGEEDKNGRRNFDEIKLWVDYLDDGATLVDDRGGSGGYESADPFVIVGDLNAAPLVEGREGDGSFRMSVYDGMAAIDQLLLHPRLQDSGRFTVSRGGLEHKVEVPRDAGPPMFFERSTSVFGEGARIDYILPSRDLEIVNGGVFWPSEDEDPEGARWADEASDHRLVWLDLVVAPAAPGG